MMALVLAAGVGAASSTDAAGRAALDQLYDGGTETALARLAGLSAAAPEDPLPAYLEALALEWKIEQRPEATSLDRELHRRVDRALAIAKDRLRQDPKDLRALLAHGAAHGVRSRLHLFRAQRREAARAALRMREDLLRLRELDPENKDALFGLGLYDYYADVLPGAVKLLRFLARMPGGDRERGLDLIERGKQSDLHRTEAQAQLYEIYAFYEDKPDRAREEIRDLRRRYPGSPLWALKLAEHERDRMGLYAESAAGARQILRAAEAGHPNYAPVVGAMARIALGEALLLDLRLPEARRALLAAKDGAPDAAWIGPKARYLLGRSLELEGDREGALAHYRLAAAAGDRELKRRAQAALASPIPPREVHATALLAEARRLRETGHEHEAAELYREALSAWPDCQEAALRAAEEDLRQGRVDAARGALEDLSRERSPRPPWVRPWSWLLLARAHDLAGEREAAVKAYKKVWEAPLGQARLRELAAAGLERPYAPEPGAAAVRRRSDYSK